MRFIKMALILCLILLTINAAQAQNRQYHIFADTDNNGSSGCDVNWPGLGSSINGIEQRLTVTTDSQLPPNILDTQVHLCQGNIFGSGTTVGQAAIGLNTGSSGHDVFEISINRSQLGINQSGNVLFYFATESDAADDVVLSANGGGPIFFGFAFPVPTLGWLGLALLISLLLLISRKNLNKHFKTTAVLMILTSTAWAMSIIIDGQTNDWSGVTAVADDPVGDTDGTGSYADITAIFQARQEDQLYFRMDVVDVENQAPVANNTADSTSEEQAVTITLTGSDAEGAAITFMQGTAPANGSLSNFTVINNTTSTVDYTPDADFAGTDSFTVVANDGQVDSAPATVTVTVNPINDAPSFTSGGNVNVLKTAGPYSQTWATAIAAGPADEASQNLTFNITANDNAAIFTQQPAIDANGLLTFTGVNNATGTANLTVELMDDGGTANGGMDTSAAVNFSITLQGVNDEPSFTAGTDQTVLEDAGAQVIAAWATNILAGPPDEAGQNLTFNVTNNTNAALFSAGPAIAADGTLSYTTAADANGTATITIELMDDGGTANGGDDTSPAQSFDITVTAVNDAPSFTAGSNQSVLEGAGAQTVNNWATAISAGPADENGQTLNFSVSNDNNALFTVQPSIDASGNLTYTPEGSTLGSATVTVSLSDNGGVANGGVDASADQTFTISVTQVNDEPSFTAGADQTVLEDAGAQVIAAWATNILAGPPDESGQNLTFNVTNNTNAALFSAGPAIAADGTLSYTTAADANGTATITIELMDDGGTANGGDDTSPPQSFNVTVTPVNDAPNFTSGGDVAVLEDSGAYMMPWAPAISPGPADEAAQNVTFNISNDNNALFSVQPTLSATGDLSFTTTADAAGVATVTVSLMDDGGVANGGADTSANQTFTISLTDVNDEPSFTVGADQTVNENSGNNVVANWATNLSTGPASEAGQMLTFNVTNNSNAALFSAGPAVAADGTLTFTPTADLFGTATITIELMDDGGTANSGDDTSPTQSFMIEVLEANTPPTLTAPGPFDVNANIGISVTDGADDLLAGANDADPTDTLSIQGTGMVTTTQGGNVVINTTTGTFTYDPPAGFTGADGFDYVVCDDGTPQECTAATQVTLNVAGPVIWFIDNTASAGNGMLQTPFNSLAAFGASSDPGAGDFIYLDTGSGTYNEAGITLALNQTLIGQGTTGSFDGIFGLTPAAYSLNRPTLNGTNPQIISSADGISLFSNNTVRGVDVGNTVGYAFAGQTVGNVTIDEVSVTGTGGAFEVTTSGNFISVNFDQLDSNTNSVMGLNLQNVDGTMTVINPGSGIVNNSGSPALRVNGGNLSLSYPGTINNSVSRAVDILNKTGGTITLSGNITDTAFGIWLTNNNSAITNITGNLSLTTGLNPAFNASGGGTVSVSGTNNIINTTTGLGVSLQNVTIGAAGFVLNQVNVNGSSTGIVLDTVTGPGLFQVTGTGNTAGSGGTIQNNSTSGITIMNTDNVSLNNMNFINSTNESPGCLADVTGVTGTCHAALELLNANNITINNTVIDGNGDISDELGIFAHEASNLNMNGVTIQNVSDQVNEHGIYAINLTGTNRWQNLTVNNTAGDTSILLVQNAGTGTLTIEGDSTLSGAPEGGFEARTVGVTAQLTVNIGNGSPVGSGDTVLIENTNTGALFVANQGNLVANVNNSIIQPGGGTMFVALSGQSDAAGNVTMNTVGNLITQDDGGNGGTGRAGTAIGGSGRASGDVTNNTISSNDEFINGLFSNFLGTGTINDNIINVDGNTIDMSGSGGNETIVGIQYRASNSNGGLTFNIANNTIDSAGDNSFSGGIVSLSGNQSGTHNNTLCNDIVNNDVSAPAAIGGSDDYVFVSFSGTDNQLENSQLGALTETHIDTHIIGNDSGITTAGDVFVYPVGTGTFTGVNSCPQ